MDSESTEAPEGKPYQEQEKPTEAEERESYQEQEDSFADIPVPPERGAAHELVKEFVSEEGIEGKTILSKRQISAFTRLEIFNRDYPEFEVGRLKRYMLLKISEGGHSRKGLLDMLKGNVPLHDSDMTSRGMERGNGRRF